MTVRLMSDNYLDADILANVDQSSEQTSFPASNVYEGVRRSKVWRTNGHWEIASGANTLKFRETSAVDLTATLTAQQYDSDSALFAEIKTQMEAVGGSTYTIERDTTTNKIKFTSNGVGGGGIFELRWSQQTTLAGVLGFGTSDDTGALAYLADVLRLHTSEWIELDFGINTNPEAVWLTGSRNGFIQISPTATIKIQGNNTTNWSSPTDDIALTYNDKIIGSATDGGLFSAPQRYARINIEDVSNPAGFVELGAVFVGNFIEMTRGRVQYPFTGQYLDRSNVVFSEGGQTFADIKEQTEQFQLRWDGLTKGDKEDVDEFFGRVGISRTWFIQMDQNAAFSSTSEYYTRLVQFAAAPQYTLVSPNNFSLTATILENI